jgi:hypothetical protein
VNGDLSSMDGVIENHDILSVDATVGRKPVIQLVGVKHAKLGLYPVSSAGVDDTQSLMTMVGLRILYVSLSWRKYAHRWIPVCFSFRSDRLSLLSDRKFPLRSCMQVDLNRMIPLWTL